MKAKNKFRLCYVNGRFAYFTSKDLDKQWADDWDDKSYEHNAGEPYEPSKSLVTSKEAWEKKTNHKYARLIREFKSKHGDKEYDMVEFSEYDEKGEGMWEIKKMAFDGDFEDPGQLANGNSQWSVEEINKGLVPWLVNKREGVAIFAGVTMEEFAKKIKEGKGKVYREI